MDKVLDTYSALWVSHSTISDFLACPRAYFLKNVYKEPASGRKIKLMSPPLALGSAVHEVLENLSSLSTMDRFTESLVEKLDVSWNKITGKKGGFISENQEEQYKKKARLMLERITKHKGPLAKKAVKIRMTIPYYWLSVDDAIILCGKLDWLEYLEETDSIHIIDFKTGASDEADDSLQLPIYYLLAQNCQNRKVSKMSYWYLDRSDTPMIQKIPDTKKIAEKILKIAKEMKLAKQLERFKCPFNGCRSCKPYEKIIKNEATYVGVDDHNKSTYILSDKSQIIIDDSVIL